MANGVFNIAKGRAKEMYNRVVSNDPATSQLVIIAFTGVETDDTIEACETITAVLATSLAEANFTNYARIDLNDTDLAVLPAPDHGADTNSWTLSDQTINSAGGTLDNTLTRVVVAYDSTGSDADSVLLPLTFHDFPVTTNGGNLTFDFGTDVFTAS